ncbi:MAG: PKD domain-containing protein [Capnocytophaga sp.]|nr:PKD domain-containing protein [Capnocytophaga sp.]
MDKIFTRWTLLIFAFIVAIVTIAWLLRDKVAKTEIRAWVTPKEVELGNPIRFIDSTLNVKEVLWEFGNGDISTEKNGSYVFPQSGRYQVRLKVDNSLEQRFIVTVKDSKRITDFRPIRIIAPRTALQNEYISFFADGYSKEWRWEFGETGDVDSYEKNPTYSYKLPGVYQVQLLSEDTSYPIIHHIEILPEYNETDTSDVLSLIAKDIQERLQNIIEGASFNENYNYILNKYLCNDPNQAVIINGMRQSDFYSYCYELKIIGSQSTTTINEVVVEPDKDSNCVKRILVKQHSSIVTK